MKQICVVQEDETLNLLRHDALLRLEWDKVTQALASRCLLPHTRRDIVNLSPWLIEEKRALFLQATGEMLHLQMTAGASAFSLDVFDLDLFARPLQQQAQLSGLALFHIGIVLGLSEKLSEFFRSEKTRAGQFPHLSAVCATLKSHVSVRGLLQKSLDEEGNVLPAASSALQLACQKRDQAKRRIIDFLEDYIRKSHVKNALQDAVWMLRDDRYVLPVRADRKGEIAGHMRGVSQSGSTLFIEPEALAGYQSQLEKARMDVEIEEQRVLRDLSRACVSLADDISDSCGILTYIDEICARASLAKALSGVSPVFLPKSMKNDCPVRFSFYKAQHPLFILENKPCVANTLELASSSGVAPLVWVLSGPNAGGKTVAMKTIGLTVLMAKAGLFVSCEKAELIDFTDVFVELGDRQSREDDLSSFSGHLAQIKKVLAHSHNRSLVLLDEGFVGTDPAIGMAMARATLETLADKGVTLVVTTHFSNLKILADSDSRFFNGSMEFEPYRLLPTYRVLAGIPGQSYAVELAERMGIDAGLLHKTRSYYSKQAQQMENLLRELQRKNLEADEELKKQKELVSSLSEELSLLRQEKEKLGGLRQQLIQSYQKKLEKRLNAFENRLEVRERQFERHQASALSALQENSFSLPDSPDAGSQAVETEKAESLSPVIHSGEKKKTFSSFADLSHVRINSANREERKRTEIDERIERFREPRVMSKRALLDEAQESAEWLKRSLDGLDEDLRDDIALLSQAKETADRRESQAREAARQARQESLTRSADFWQSGMDVLCARFRGQGSVLRPADKRGDVECQFGVLKVKVSHEELRVLGGEDPCKKRKNGDLPLPASPKARVQKQKPQRNLLDPDLPSTFQHAGNTVDLRGMAVEEAIEKLEREIDIMSRQGVSTLCVIHGYGTGRVKEGVRAYLEACPYTLRFRGGRIGEGGDGVTVLCLGESV